MSRYIDFTSLPPEEEATFIVYEQRSQESAKSAMKIALITGAVVAFLTVLIVFSFDAPENLMAKDDIGMLGDQADNANLRNKLKTNVPTTPTTPSAGAATRMTMRVSV